MGMLISARCMTLDIGGKKIRVAVGNDMTEDKMNRILIVGKASLQQYVYVEAVLADCFMLMIESSLLKKKVFRFGVKKLWNECRENLRKTIGCYDVFATNADFNNEYAITYWDNIKDDIYRLRDKMATRFSNFGYGNKSGLYANVIVLYNLLIMCLNTYEAIMARLKERLGVNLTEVYLEFCPVKAFDKSYDFMKEVMGEDFKKLEDHAVTRDIAAYFEKVRDGVFSEKIMNDAAIVATDGMSEKDKELQRSYVGVDDVMSPDFPIDSVRRKVS